MINQYKLSLQFPMHVERKKQKIKIGPRKRALRYTLNDSKRPHDH
jgi:hypothetical protein